MEFLKRTFSNEYELVDVWHKQKFMIKNKDFYLSIGSNFHLAEMPLYPSPVLVDVDIKALGSSPKQLYDENMVKTIIKDYITEINKNLKEPQQVFKILFLSKPSRVCEDTVKHGFHLHFINCFLNKEDLKRIYNGVCAVSEFGEYLDDVSCKPWLLYGASKTPNDNPYLIEKGYLVEDNEIEEIKYQNLFVGENIMGDLITHSNIDKYLPALMSIRSCSDFYKNKVKTLIPLPDTEVKKPPRIPKSCKLPSNNKLRGMVDALKNERADSYDDWINIGLILTGLAKIRDEDFFKELYHTFSSKSEKYDQYECDLKWESLMKSTYDDGLGVGTLIFMAREDGYKDETDALYFPTDDYDISKLVKQYICETSDVIYMTRTDVGCYKFEKTIWKEVKGWQDVFRSHISEWGDVYMKDLENQIENIEDEKTFVLKKKQFQKLKSKLNNFNSRQSIAKSLFDHYFSDNIDKLFEQNRSELAFSNVTLDLQNMQIVTPSPSHYLTQCIPHDYIDWTDVPEDNKNFINDFWSKIFPDEDLKNYCLSNFARFLSGTNTHKQFQFWTGTGNNGKSVCISLLEYVFGQFIMKIPKSMVMGVPTKQGSTNPELCRLKNARIAVIDEVTNNDYLDPGQIKGLSGNDKLYGRDLYQKSKEISEIIPMFFPILITNETPIIKQPDDATWQRIRLVRFESKFKVNSKKYENSEDHVFESDPKIYDHLKKNAKYFLSQFVHIFLSSTNEEIIPEKVYEGLRLFKEGQDIIKQYIDENFIIDEEPQSFITIQKFVKDYNLLRPKITLKIEDAKTALTNYCSKNPKVIFANDRIKGLVKVD